MPPKKRPRTKTSKAETPQENSALVLTKRERALFELFIGSVLEKVTKLLSEFGIGDGSIHAQSHKDMQAVMPWIQARVKAEQKRAEFWSKLEKIGAHVLDKVIKDSAVLVMKIFLLFVIFLAIYGYSGGNKQFAEIVKRIISSF